jgi:hypothetical protein
MHKPTVARIVNRGYRSEAVSLCDIEGEALD